MRVFCDFKYPVRRRFRLTTLTDSAAMTVDRMPSVAQSSSYPRHSRGRFTPQRCYHISQAGSDKCLWEKHQTADGPMLQELVQRQKLEPAGSCFKST